MIFEADWDLLNYWDGELDSDPPQKTFEDDEGNWVALWWWTNKTDEGEDVIGGAERVTFTPEVFRVEIFVDVMEWYCDDPPTDENDEPYYTEWGEEYHYEGVEFPRDAFASFLKDVITGRIVRKTQEYTVMQRGGWVEGRGWDHDLIHPVTYTRKYWAPADKVMFLKRNKLPRTREEMAQWVKSAGGEVARQGSGGDYTYEFPEGVPDIFSV